MQLVYLWLCIIPVLAVFDFLWLGLVAKSYYSSQLGPLLSSHVVWWAAGIFYLLYAAGLVFFVIQPALAAHSLVRAVLVGAFFGLIAFATYDLTNLAATANWPVLMSFVDMAYGTVVAGLSSGIVYLLAISVFGF